MCQTLCQDGQRWEKCCECGRRVCLDARPGDVGVRPAHVTDAGIWCRPCWDDREAAEEWLQWDDPPRW